MVRKIVLGRPAHLEAIRKLLQNSPVVCILGARQVGKTTLARQLAMAAEESHFFDLEDPEDAARLQVPKAALGPLGGLVVLDEVQRRPDLFEVLRVLADRAGRPAAFLLLGSASPALVRGASESLAGRVAFYELSGFDLAEIGVGAMQRRWLRGGFPPSFLATDDAESFRWRGDFVRAFLERDLPALGLRLPADGMRRFWTMLAHYHGQVWNGAELARGLGVSESSVRHYLDVLVGTFVVRRLEPWFSNSLKRVVRSPKVYVADSGMLHRLLGLQSRDDLLSHPKVGASWEGFAMESVVRRLGARPEECWSWGLHSGAELDLFVQRGGRRLGFEFKLTDTPALTPSMRSALVELDPERIDVVHLGAHTFPLHERVRALSLARVLDDLQPL